uniref:JmjC domain-containing protein n=1 Tax=Aplanochytrium stocchinoi TaxID=215587 RepID=A0A6S8B8U7_9STRA|mmetsp:Transcript_781/g.1037  ORF Transcript_781/g.1037 Transcript_781/m.1037 type:complete len:395 (-) Transcript_781:834-2018(-)|eukprot:CAMPEP_0204824364 /NCGR_PEP_ID=MMETSP1346-20131115/2382_1 /ASSEMBLY_ACC=CAM_ASM_000771 /TAXON_ID=215587 /ORGANISM="Aplanochytrium stocchinoi, Strain GSBS06" /LENGTH=394 /DNA_ID=CAMNT_0051951465 /DNA_START=61 /DNA_END=1245 /DNA_ORIENTATION=-
MESDYSKNRAPAGESGFAFLALLIVAVVVTSCDAFEDTNSRTSRSCDFPIVDASHLSWQDFEKHFMLANRPVLFQNATIGWPAFEVWKWDTIAETFGDTPVRVGPGPYPRREMTMREYINMASTLYEKKTTLKKTEIPGVFQYGQVPTSWTLWSYKESCIPAIAYLHPDSSPLHENVTFVCEDIMKNIRVPKFLVGEDNELPPAQISHSGFLVGYPDSGIDFHKHQDAINVIFEGRKKWYMKVPNEVVQGFKYVKDTDISQSSKPVCKENLQDPVCKNGQNEQNWTKGALSRILNAKETTEEEEANSTILSCVQNAGEVVYIPDYMQHGVINLEPTIAMQMQWNREDWNSERARTVYKKYLLHTLDPDEPDPTVKKFAPGAAQLFKGPPIHEDL